MNARIWKLAAASCLAAAVACSSKDSGHTPASSGPSISLTPSATSVVANGTKTVTLSVTDTGAAAVTVTTDRGTLNGGVTSYVIPAGTGVTTGTVTLTTCNSAMNVGCAGAATVRATSTTGAASASINFTSLASACQTNCDADPGCAGLACTLTAGGTGRCSTSSPSVCSSGAASNPNAQLGGFAIPSPFATSPVMGVKSSGWNEFGSVAVQVLDDQGQPWPDGLAVHFEHRQLGGSTFGLPLGTCAGTPAPPDCVAYDATTKDGVATAPIFSGTVAGTLDVTATTTAGTVTRSVTLPGIAVVGAKASAANFSIQCSPRNVPALAETDCSTSWVDAPFTCVAILKDRFGNLLGTSTQVIFVSEAGAVGQVAWTPEYDPKSAGSDQATLGTATQIFQTLGAGLPFDVDPQLPPLVTEQFVDHMLDGCPAPGGGPRRHNPRDGVVTIIAIADGEEGFFDANGNGQYDAATASATGEPFIDQGEPFVDQNDNGSWDPGEWFLDVNGNGVYDGPNGRWDAQTKIWTQTVVVYTGTSADWLLKSAPPAPAPATYLGTRWANGIADACTDSQVPAFSVNAKVADPPVIAPTFVNRVVVASDMNLNFLASQASYGVKVDGSGKVVPTYRGLASYADELGLFYQYWPCDTAGSCASQCRARVPQIGVPASGTGPCVMKPAITDFSCGVAAGVTITGGDAPDGTNVVDFTVDVPYGVYLGSKVMHDLVTISGTNN